MAGNRYVEVGELRSLWVPYLSEGFCKSCSELLKSRLEDLVEGKLDKTTLSNGNTKNSTDCSSFSLLEINTSSSTKQYTENSPASSNRTPVSESSVRGEQIRKFSPAMSSQHSVSILSLEDDFREASLVGNGTRVQKGNELSREQSEQVRLSQVGRKKDFVFMENINGKSVNVLEGLELHSRVFNEAEQKKIVDCIYNIQRMGQKGQLRERTYSEPRKWMRGKGRVTIQFGCCYNYAVDKNGNPPGIIQDEEVDPIPPMFKTIIKRLVRWHVLPPTTVPNSCIVNLYDEGDCIPPHIDHHDFVRPFCTISFLAECNILFGSNLKILGPGEFAGPAKIPLPVGSVLILSGNGADVAKHCVPAVPAKRISITFRKMDDSKLPYRFVPDPDLKGLQPLAYTPNKSLQTRHLHAGRTRHSEDESEGVGETCGSPFLLEQDEFPPLGGSSSVNKPRTKLRGW